MSEEQPTSTTALLQGDIVSYISDLQQRVDETFLSGLNAQQLREIFTVLQVSSHGNHLDCSTEIITTCNTKDAWPLYESLQNELQTRIIIPHAATYGDYKKMPC